MQDMSFKKILQTDQTVFSFKELMIMLKIDDPDKLRSRLYYYVNQGDLYPLRRGLYAKNKEYDRFELATKIFTPSYISFETVLVKAGVIFQYYNRIFVASYQSREIMCDNSTYVFRALKSTILYNNAGIDITQRYSIASPERAFLDIVYGHKEYHFDNLEPLNWDKIYNLLPVYGDNKSMRKRVDRYYAAYKQDANI